MELHTATRVFMALLGWSLLLQTLEFFRLLKMDRVGSWAIQREEVPSRPTWVRSLLDHVVQGHGYAALLCLRLVLALGLLSGWVHPATAAVLFAISVSTWSVLISSRAGSSCFDPSGATAAR